MIKYSPAATPERCFGIRLDAQPFRLSMKYDWKDAGEEWSESWGTSQAQWTETILPRIRECLPTGTILEIGPGYGRWTHYLKDFCDRLVAVDRAAQCIDACRGRFVDDPR